jgi:hypothetical protein
VIDQMLLARSYARRKQFEARLIAVEVGKMLGGAGAPEPTPKTVRGNSGATYNVVTPEQMMEALRRG